MTRPKWVSVVNTSTLPVTARDGRLPGGSQVIAPGEKTDLPADVWLRVRRRCRFLVRAEFVVAPEPPIEETDTIEPFVFEDGIVGLVKRTDKRVYFVDADGRDRWVTAEAWDASAVPYVEDEEVVGDTPKTEGNTDNETE